MPDPGVLRDESAERGFFGPESMAWRVSRETAVLLGGRRALLLQLAHPLVAQGVADHSNFERDRLGRLVRTLLTSLTMIFGAREAAEIMIERINSVHRGVSGTLDEDAGAWKAGTPYRATDPELLMWVHATLVETAVDFYQRFVAPLSRDELDGYYRETTWTGSKLGISASILPPTYEEFEGYWREMLASDRIAVGATARRLAGLILYPGRVPNRLVDPLNIVTIGTLPPSIRNAYGLRWNPLRQAALQAATLSLRTLRPLIPAPLRFVPQARAASRRVAP